MAWQLIYTSAPRSLEAGRSGFGTVARHRAISPLLVSAIERASQFSRLPGTDAGRVIFSHRIVAVAGGRFHVLSAIRDAGADYTGRTNHIAHHLIVDPREIAQLGPDGPSPADVLLSMQWVASWNETPRFLEAADEVALSAIHPHTNGSAWEQIAGNANQAWLLATGDASRGAYIIQPGSADLRAVYAESLRLIPDRLWQISFTTSLQPSDEPGDFRWIGIEERSPLRAQSESSGRPVLNLALPDTLPLVETVQRPAVSQIRQNSAPASTPAWTDLPTVPTETSSAVSESHSPPTRQRTGATSGASPTRSSRISPKWWLLTGAVAAVALIGAVMFSIFVKPYLHRQTARNALAKNFEDSAYFPHDISQRLADDLITSADESRCEALANASKALVQTLFEGDLQKIKSEPTINSLKVLENRDGLRLPEELGHLRETVKEAQRLSDKPPEVEKQRDVNELVSIMKKRHEDISKLDPEKRLQNLVRVLHSNADQQQAEGLLTIVQQRMPPPGGIESFKQIVAAFKKNVLDPTAKKTIEQVDNHLDKLVKSQPTLKPEPMERIPPLPTTKAEIAVVKPTASSQVPLYFVREFDALSKVPMPELEGDAAFYLVAPLDKPERLLFEDPRKDASSPASVKLHIDANATEIAFAAKANGISCEAGSKNIPLPFSIVARKKADKVEMVRVFFIREMGGPLFKGKKIQIKLVNGALSFALDELGLPGIPNKNQLKLELPQDWAYSSNKTPKVPFVDGGFSLALLKAELDAERKRMTTDIANCEASLKEILSFSRDAEFGKLHGEFMEISNLAQKIQDEKKRRKEEADKRREKPAELPEEEYLRSNIPVERQYGGCIAAYSVANGVMRAYFVHADEMLSAGIELFRSEDKNKFEKQIKKAQEVTGKAIANLSKKEDKEKYLNNLNKLQGMALMLLDAGKPQREARQAKINADLTALRAKLAGADSHPLTRGKVPNGIYRLQAVVDGLDVPIMDIEVSPP